VTYDKFCRGIFIGFHSPPSGHILRSFSMATGDETKIAFKIHHRHFQFRVMPFGLTNVTSTFQCLMNSVLAPYIKKFVLIFMDDILIYSSSLTEHVQHLQLIFKVLLDNKLFLKFSKCAFGQQIEYLGHIISHKGVATDPGKTEAMVKWPTPQSFTEVRGFLGLTGYYRKFVKNYGVIAKHLTDILKLKTFQWTLATEIVFQDLKKAMCSVPVLSLPDFSQPFEIEVDACDKGVGAVLQQKEHPIAFFSKALSIYNQKCRHLIVGYLE
jgi:hypothetical protein